MAGQKGGHIDIEGDDQWDDQLDGVSPIGLAQTERAGHIRDIDRDDD
jgi:hypothetical protein